MAYHSLAERPYNWLQSPRIHPEDYSFQEQLFELLPKLAHDATHFLADYCRILRQMYVETGWQTLPGRKRTQPVAAVFIGSDFEEGGDRLEESILFDGQRLFYTAVTDLEVPAEQQTFFEPVSIGSFDLVKTDMRKRTKILPVENSLQKDWMQALARPGSALGESLLDVLNITLCADRPGTIANIKHENSRFETEEFAVAGRVPLQDSESIHKFNGYILVQSPCQDLYSPYGNINWQP